jgi:hypothetical protein
MSVRLYASTCGEFVSDLGNSLEGESLAVPQSVAIE